MPNYRLQETVELARGTDSFAPLFKSETNKHLRHGILYIESSAEEGRPYDLLIVPLESEWILFWCDSERAVDRVWGVEWFGGRIFTDWEDLVKKVYAL